MLVFGPAPALNGAPQMVRLLLEIQQRWKGRVANMATSLIEVHLVPVFDPATRSQKRTTSRMRTRAAGGGEEEGEEASCR